MGQGEFWELLVPGDFQVPPRGATLAPTSPSHLLHSEVGARRPGPPLFFLPCWGPALAASSRSCLVTPLKSKEVRWGSRHST